MVVKKYIKRGEKVFGPYYYESVRENGKVVHKYIGGEKEYSLWKKKRNKGSLKTRYHTRFSLFLLLLLIVGFIFIFSTNSVLNGYVISESVEQKFDSDIANLEVRNPSTSLLGETVSRNKNKRMEFSLPDSQIILYFNLYVVAQLVTYPYIIFFS